MVDLVAVPPQGGVIAADTNAIHDYLGDQSGPKFRLVKEAVDRDALLLPPVVLTEVLSDPALPATAATSATF
jgi:hypothetical protein